MSYITKIIEIYAFIMLLIVPLACSANSNGTVSTDKIKSELVKELNDMSCAEECPENQPFYYYVEAAQAVSAIETLINMADTKQVNAVKLTTMDNDSLIIIEVSKFKENVINDFKNGKIPCVNSNEFISERLDNQFILRVIINKEITENYIPLKTLYMSSIDIFQTDKKNLKTYKIISATDDSACFHAFSNHFNNKK